MSDEHTRPASDQPPATNAAGDGGLSEEDVYEALEEVIDPELGLDFVSLGLVYDVAIEQEDVYVTFTLTTPACPIGPQVSEQMQRVRRRPPRRRRRPPEDDLRPALVAGNDDRRRQVRARLLSRRYAAFRTL